MRLNKKSKLKGYGFKTRKYIIHYTMLDYNQVNNKVNNKVALGCKFVIISLCE